jgi:hypothetical protein
MTLSLRLKILMLLSALLIVLNVIFTLSGIYGQPFALL